jgi:beta-galactosidase
MLQIEPWSTYITTPKISAGSAEIMVSTRVSNPAMKFLQAIVKQEIMDPDGKVVGTGESTQTFNTQVPVLGAIRDYSLAVNIASPQLWSPEKPKLYTLHTTVITGENIADEARSPFGIRSLEYDVNKGLLLNGQHTKLLGMCLHHDGGAMGAAVPIEVWERRLTALKAMGCNAIRCSHNPPAPEFLDLCDRLGFLVMDEAFDEWTAAKGQLRGSYATLFNDNYKNDLTAMIRRDRNHPSIVMWSIGNEIPQQTNQRGVDIAKSLAAICRAEDPTRPTTVACDNVHSPNPTWPAFLDAVDIAGYNYVDRWNEHREIFFSDDREKYPTRKFVGTEDVCIGGTRNSYFGNAPAGRGPAVPFGYASQMIRAEQLWKFNATHDYVIGYFMWTGIDYLGEAGAWPRKGSGSGVLDTCAFPKDGYYFYQSQWTTTPMVHAFPHWNYPGDQGTIIPVVVYSNCPQVELQLNGKSYGTKSLVFPRPGSTRSWNDPTPTGTTADLHLTWDVPYEPGTLKILGKRNGQVITQEEIKTAGVPAKLALKLDRTTLSASTRGVAQIEFRILDAEGTLVPTANIPITLTIEGPAKLIGFDNGDQSSHDSYQSLTRPAFNGMALATLQAGKTPGHVKVIAKAEGLPEQQVEFDVVPGAPVAALP